VCAINLLAVERSGCGPGFKGGVEYVSTCVCSELKSLDQRCTSASLHLHVTVSFGLCVSGAQCGAWAPFASGCRIPRETGSYFVMTARE
jgi:hypothetical protein